jgi:hypothetical protein
MRPDETDGLRPDRQNTILVGAHLDASIAKELRVIAASELSTMAAIIHEMVALLLEKRGKPLPPALVRDLDQFKTAGRRRMHRTTLRQT